MILKSAEVRDQAEKECTYQFNSYILVGVEIFTWNKTGEEKHILDGFYEGFTTGFI